MARLTVLVERLVLRLLHLAEAHRQERAHLLILILAHTRCVLHHLCRTAASASGGGSGGGRPRADAVVGVLTWRGGLRECLLATPAWPGSRMARRE